jgi:F-type H+-transporting ATPase subunit gamma
MAGTRAIMLRRKAADSICRITRTMEMLSTARYRAYHNRWVSIVDYHDALARAGYLLVSSNVPVEHPLLKDNASGRRAVMAIGSSRGLCGGYNNAVYRIVDAHVHRAKTLGIELDVYAPERKILPILHYHGITPTKVYSEIGEIPTAEQLDAIADEFIEQYMDGKLDYFSIVYMRYFSATSQQAQTLTIMPLTELIDDLTTRSTVIWPWDLGFEDFYLSPPADHFVEALARMIIRSSMEMCFMDAALSEHLARMVAMRNATENAEEMIKELTAQYNRERQGQITAELLDIIGGTGALR